MNTERRQAGRRSLSLVSLAARLHRDERGSLSVMGVFAVFFLTVLLGMIFNVGREVDDKLRMQNTADAAAYSGTLTVSRGMNAIAYSNHLLCEIFALTAYMREARLDGDHLRNSTHLAHSDLSPDVLETWERVATEAFGTLIGPNPSPPLDKFKELGQALQVKIKVEREMVDRFREMSREHSQLTLSVFEYILRGQGGKFPVENTDYPYDAPQGGLITRFQRSVVRFTPEMAQRLVQEIAQRHGRSTQSQHRGYTMTAVMYRTDATRFDEYREDDRDLRLLPVIDPTLIGGDLVVSPAFDPRQAPNYIGLTHDQIYFKQSYDKRTQLARHYLQYWINVWMDTYFTKTNGRLGRDVGNLSQLANLWRVFTCAQLNKLLHEEFPKSNLPFEIRVINENNWYFQNPNSSPVFQPDLNTLGTEYSCVAVVAWPHTRQFAPGVYRNPLNGNPRTVSDDTYAFTFAQAKFFVPLRQYRCCPWGEWRYNETLQEWYFITYYNNWPRDWSSFNQNWRTKLVPCWTNQLPAILARHPGGSVKDLSVPNLRGLTVQEIRLLNPH